MSPLYPPMSPVTSTSVVCLPALPLPAKPRQRHRSFAPFQSPFVRPKGLEKESLPHQERHFSHNKCLRVISLLSEPLGGGTILFMYGLVFILLALLELIDVRVLDFVYVRPCFHSTLF